MNKFWKDVSAFVRPGKPTTVPSRVVAPQAMAIGASDDQERDPGPDAPSQDEAMAPTTVATTMSGSPIYVGDKTLLVTTHLGDILYIDSEDNWITPQILTGDRGDADLLDSLVGPDMHVVDVGAGSGRHAITAARRVGPGGRVLAVEANPGLARRQIRSIYANRYEGWTSVMNAAATDVDSEAEFTIPDEGSGFGTLFGGTRAGVRITAKTYPLDMVVADRPVDVLTIDVEGAEALVWNGAQRIIATSPTLKVLMNFIPGQVAYVGDPGSFIDRTYAQGFEIQEIGHDRSLQPGDRDRLLSRSSSRLLLTRRS